MRKTIYGLFGLLTLAAALPLATAQDKPAAAAGGGTVKVKVHYTGSGTVDDKHKIMVFLFDTPAFSQGTAIPFASQGATSKKDVVTFTDVAKSPAYVAIVFDPTGKYDGMSAPPSGASLGMYSSKPPTPSPVNVKPGKTVTVAVDFDDMQKMP